MTVRRSTTARLLGAAVLVAAASACGSDDGSPPATSSVAAVPAPARCASSASLEIRRGSLPAQICLRVGSLLSLSSVPLPQERWEEFTSSDAAVLQCLPRTSKGGQVSGTCTALAPGVADVRTATRPVGGSTAGPGDNPWLLTVTVVAE